MQEHIGSVNPNDLSKSFFHYIEALPRLARTTDFSEPRTEFEFFNQFKHFAIAGFPNNKIQSDKRTAIALIFQLLKTKAQSQNNPALKKLLEKGIKFAVNNLYHQSMPDNIYLSGHDAFKARCYLENQVLAMASKLTNNDQALKKEVGNLLAIISSPDSFRSLLEVVNAHSDELEAIRETHSDYNYDLGRSRDDFDFSQKQAWAQKLRNSFNRIVGATSQFISTNTDKSGFNCKFLGILKSELNEPDYPQDISVNFSESIEDDIDLIHKQVDMTIETMNDLISMGYKNFGFANFLREYAFSDFAGVLSCHEDMSAVESENLVLEFLNKDNKFRDFKTFACLSGTLSDPAKADEYVQSFINFIDKLKMVILKNDIEVQIFPIDDGSAMSDWQTDDGVNRVCFNNNYFAAQASDTYNIKFNLFKYDPSERYITDDDLESCSNTSIWDGEGLSSTELSLDESLPLVLLNIANQANQPISDGDVFTIAAAEELNQFVRDSFELDDGSPITGSSTDFFPPSFERFDTEIEPDLHKIVFVEHKDDEDGDTWSDSEVPDSSLLLT